MPTLNWIGKEAVVNHHRHVPYNTGNEGWIYNDNVNSPEINHWLGQVVGREAEDLSRHDKWLCMMYPRLAVLVGTF
jgi:hypothetical protein